MLTNAIEKVVHATSGGREISVLLMPFLSLQKHY